MTPLDASRSWNPATYLTDEPWLAVVLAKEWSHNPTLLLLDPTSKKYAKTRKFDDAILGFVSIEELGEIDGGEVLVHRIEFSSATKGYGPLAYEVVMHLLNRPTTLGRVGVLAPGEEVSDAARSLWKGFAKRRDYRHGRFRAQDKIETDHAPEYLDGWYAPAARSRLPGLNDALANGEAFVKAARRRLSLSRVEVERQLVLAGYRVFRKAMADLPRRAAPARTFDLLGWLRREKRRKRASSRAVR